MHIANAVESTTTLAMDGSVVAVPNQTPVSAAGSTAPIARETHAETRELPTSAAASVCSQIRMTAVQVVGGTRAAIGKERVPMQPRSKRQLMQTTLWTE